MADATRWLLVGPRHSRRIGLMQQALQAAALPLAVHIAYEDLLDDAHALTMAMQRHPDALIKLESPGESPDLHDALIRRGWQLTSGNQPPPAALQHGELAHQAWWHTGFAALLQALPPSDRYCNPPEDLLLMADKFACQQRLQACGVSVPSLLGLVHSHAHLQLLLDDSGCHDVFIKPRYGSSGAGILAYRRHASGRVIATGPVEGVTENGQLRLFNVLRPRRHTDARHLAPLVDAIARQGAYVERWIPKPAAPQAAGHQFDVRIVTLDGQPRQRVARLSRGPLTNLHLGNRRASLDGCLSPQAQQRLEAVSVQASAAFPGSRVIGFDVIAAPQRCHVLEANGFGDLLLDVRWQGRGTYDDQARLVPRTAMLRAMESMHA